MLEFILIIQLILPDDTKQSRAIPMESSEACFSAAQSFADESVGYLRDFGAKALAAGCMVRIKEQKS